MHLFFWTAGAAVGFITGLGVLRIRRVLTSTTVLALGVAWGGLVLGANVQFRLEMFPLSEVFRGSWEAFFWGPMRLPLGLFTGGIAALAFCVAAGAPWRETGDALGVAASVMVPLGRIGCVMSGCCVGTVCPSWMEPLCWRYGPGTQAYEQQWRDRLVTLGDPMSLPAHPLPLYFALTSLLTLGLLVWLLRRRAPAGALLATFSIVQPLAALLLEPLRATPRQGSLMVAIPLMMLLLTCAWLGWQGASRVGGRRAERRSGKPGPRVRSTTSSPGWPVLPGKGDGS